MSTARTGTLRGKLVELDEALPLEDGTRVRLVIESEDAEVVLTPADQAALFQRWADHGPQGPIDDDDAGW